VSTEEQNMQLMQTLDDAWNAQDVEVFRQRHKPDVVVRWPGKPPTHGIEDHVQESIEFWQTFPDQHLDNRPYRVFFASEDWTCSIAHFTGTMTGPMKGPDGEEIPPPASRSRLTSARSPSGTMARSWRRTSCTTSSRS
jgi:SnoaL-like polyketide cyclase